MIKNHFERPLSEMIFFSDVDEIPNLENINFNLIEDNPYSKVFFDKFI